MPKWEENIIIDCLKLQGFENMEYEPDGNVTPDILLNGKIAIEVRRLNENQLTEKGLKGYEEAEGKICGILRNIFSEVSDNSHEQSAYVDIFFERPVPKKKVLEKKVREILKIHRPKIHELGEYKIGSNIKLRFVPSEKRLRKEFLYRSHNDMDSGGFIVGLIYDNLKLVIEDKEKNVKNSQKNYPEWWLALVDTIGHGMIDLYLEQLNDFPKIESKFNRILLVSPSDPSNYTYLSYNKL